ncbi:cobalt-precorrin-5B (C(1))-methyltransferase [Asaia siamensis]|uniref:Cobalt-precorrin-5B C(1)-methyltransferase n=1 Tax=Asaia siamensis TaxID=110479 RepID=A0ABQ1L4S6_9PROT|nr:cobalt-precorrin-5B (C(1))-methyltransferase [Asaia siamensis]GBR09604.1 cobalamin biosynthesis protein cobalt-precorrin-6A biosynthesis protein CbiD [Asaia siamensis NRIC 0323]GGC19620.1 cobalt-precorrin-5B C(1)-methyltransferase [Asaia siamensis]
MTQATALRRGWTTGSCATAAAKAAWALLVIGDCPDPVTITLPGGGEAAFSLDGSGRNGDTVWARVVKDAGDDPDVTHGALITVTVARASTGSGIVFRAGSGVGTITQPGLPLPPGEPAINPVPRKMIRTALEQITPGAADAIVTISIADGEELAKRTLNARLGILGGLSVLGTTGIVIPYSCSAWIHSIHRGVDVARALNLPHIAGSTGSTSEKSVRSLYTLPDPALIEMGDFAGGFLKYLHRHPVPRLTIAGGLAKMTKLAQGHLDLHSSRTLADPQALALIAAPLGLTDAQLYRLEKAQTIAQGYTALGDDRLGSLIAQRAAERARDTLADPECQLDVVIFDRQGALLGRSTLL